MARARSAPKEEKAPERKYPLPEGYEDMPESWVNAFEHAMSMQYTAEKGAILFADAHMHDKEFGAKPDDPATIQAEIEKLQARLAQVT